MLNISRSTTETEELFLQYPDPNNILPSSCYSVSDLSLAAERYFLSVEVSSTTHLAFTEPLTARVYRQEIATVCGTDPAPTSANVANQATALPQKHASLAESPLSQTQRIQNLKDSPSTVVIDPNLDHNSDEEYLSGESVTRLLYPGLVTPRLGRAPYDPYTGMNLGCGPCNRWRSTCDLEAPCQHCVRRGKPHKCLYVYKEPYARNAPVPRDPVVKERQAQALARAMEIGKALGMRYKPTFTRYDRRMKPEKKKELEAIQAAEKSQEALPLRKWTTAEVEKILGKRKRDDIEEGDAS